MCWGVDYLLIQVTSVYPFFCNLFLQVVLHPHRPIHSPLVPVFMFPFQICVCTDPGWCPCSSVSCTSNLKGSTTTLQQTCPHRNLRWAMPLRLPFLPFVLGRPYSDPTLVHVSYCNLTKPWEFVAFIERKNPCIEWTWKMNFRLLYRDLFLHGPGASSSIGRICSLAKVF